MRVTSLAELRLEAIESRLKDKGNETAKAAIGYAKQYLADPDDADDKLQITMTEADDENVQSS